MPHTSFTRVAGRVQRRVRLDTPAPEPSARGPPIPTHLPYSLFPDSASANGHSLRLGRISRPDGSIESIDS
jgi:hypothetical protein